MRYASRTSITAAGLVLGLGLWIGSSGSHGAQDRRTSLYGGAVAAAGRYYFEVVFARGGLWVYPRTRDDRPIDASRLTGTATFYHPNSPKPWFERKLTPVATPGQPSPFLGLRIDLSTVPESGAKVEFRVDGLPEAAERAATFTVPFALPQSSELTVTRATAADQAAINAQRVCKVSGEGLGSMGVPVKVSRGGKSVLLCCQGCLRTVLADPDRFLGNPAAAGTRNTK